MKKENVMLILSIAFFITVCKLYWKPASMWSHVTGSLPSSASNFNVLEQALCPVTGIKCPDAEHCDCRQLCGSSSNFERVKLYSTNNVILSGIEKDPNSYYCLPKDSNRFYRDNAKLVYTGEWNAISKHPHVFNSRGQMVACASPYARNNTANTLFDHKTNRPVTLRDDIHLRELHNGKLRYSCKCGSKDLRNNDMMTLPGFPLSCFTDYCKFQIFSAGFPGYMNGKCNCGPLTRHLVPGDPRSPCVMYTMDDSTFNVPCIDKNTIKIAGSHFYCPDSYNSNVINQILYTKHYETETSLPEEILDKMYHAM